MRSATAGGYTEAALRLESSSTGPNPSKAAGRVEVVELAVAGGDPDDVRSDIQNGRSLAALGVRPPLLGDVEDGADGADGHALAADLAEFGGAADHQPPERAIGMTPAILGFGHAISRRKMA